MKTLLLFKNKKIVPAIKIFLAVLLLLTLSLFAKTLINKFELYKMKQDCLKVQFGSERVGCLQGYFEKITIEKSAGEAIGEAVKLSKEGFIGQCHMAAHFIGEANFRKFNGDVDKAFPSCPQDCLQGCHHGVMSAYIIQFPDVQKAFETVPNLCQSLSQDNWLKRQCLHGVGHGLVSHSGIGEGSLAVTSAVNICKKFADNFSSQTCLGGVVMENMFTFLQDENFTKNLNNICAPFIQMNDDYLINLCAQQVGEGLMFYTGGDRVKSKQLCSLIDSKYQAQCFDGVIRESKLDQLEF